MKYAVKCGKLYLALMENGGKEERCEDSRKQLRKKKRVSEYCFGNSPFKEKSGQQDLNLRPLGPQPSALPSYAIPRTVKHYSR